MVHDERIPLAKPIIDEEMIAESERVLREEFFLRGDSVQEFEEEFADYIGSKHAVAVDSGTRALYFSLRALGVSEGDTVVTTPATFISTANTILMTGATPEFVDVSLDTYTMDLEDLEETLEQNEVSAIIPVHLYGYPVNIGQIHEIAPDIPVVSDACQSHGAKYGDERVGSQAELAAFSFYPSKNMTVAGDGGMVTTDNGEFARYLRVLRDVGRGDGPEEHELVGYTARMNTINAAIGRRQLSHLDDWNQRRQEIAGMYSDALQGVDDLKLPPTGGSDVHPAWYLYVVCTAYRDDLAAFLDDRGVETGIHYGTPVHLQKPYRERGFTEGMYPRSEQWAEEVLSLPIHPDLRDDQVNRVIDAVTEFFSRNTS